MLLNREPFFNENHLSTDINSKNTGFYPLQTINDNYSIVNHISYDLYETGHIIFRQQFYCPAKVLNYTIIC